MQIIDFHTHIYPEPVAAKAAKNIRDFYNIYDASLDGSADHLLAYGKEAGISKYVVLPVAVKANNVKHINSFIMQQVAEHSEFIGFGTLHAQMDNLTDECERILKCGLKGIKFHPDFQTFDIDDPRLYPAYEILQGKVPIIFHTGDKRYDYSNPRRLRHILELFPNLHTIGAHFGGYSMYESAYEELKDTNCFFDISSSLMFMEDGIAESYIRKYGAERMVYGTDFPLWDPRIEVPRFMNLKLTSNEFEQIAWKTASNILNL